MSEEDALMQPNTSGTDNLRGSNAQRTPDELDQYLSQLNKILTRKSSGKSIMKEEVLAQLNSSIYGINLASSSILGYDHEYANWKMRDGPEAPGILEMLMQIENLVQFVENLNEKESISDLIRVLGSDRPASLGAIQPIQAWRLLWYSLYFNHSVPWGTQVIKTQVQSLFNFPPPPHEQSFQPFELTLKKLLEVDLEISPTSDIREHLQLEGNRVKILKLDAVCAITLGGYNRNRIAKALGIESLGEEILSSLNVLYGRDRLCAQAEMLGLGGDWVMNTFVHRETFLANHSALPRVLMSRVYRLEQAILRRRSWLPSLLRDVRKSKREQPLVFWGWILALFFGTFSILQTIASYWSIILAYRALNAP
ncbi:hypothetical protein BDQ12DRAFT_668296 [Crucibulum laeve]|uniref:Uncharacterized protein n=1 Tax=Crucibulum laeve TaxID=68775 RepID=A0A5C3LS52_9AGAR|nr:hypothetical protein BDQ12DRAFT_668296 [Crucibulum laeve]